MIGPFKEALAHTAEEIRRAAGGPDDPYLAYHYEGHYCWGSNQCKGRWGRVLLMAIALGVNPGASRSLPRAGGRLPPLHPRTQPAVALLLDQHGPRRRRPLPDRALSRVVSRRLTALRRQDGAAMARLRATWSAVPTSSSPWIGSLRPTASRR